MCTLVAGVLGRKEFPPIPDKKRHVPHVQLTGPGAGSLQVTLQGLVHSTCRMSAQPIDELFPAGLEAVPQTLTAQRFWLPMCEAG